MRVQRCALAGLAALLVASMFVTSRPTAAAGATDASADPVPATAVLSARRLPEVLLGAVADQRYISSIDGYLNRTSGTSCAVIVQNGRVIYERGSGETLAPASTIKLLTATAALEVLGPDTRLTTRIVSPREPEDGTIEGDLTIIGAGDPLLTTQGYKRSLENPDQLTEDFASVADAIVSAGVRRVTGRIVGDESALDRTRWIPSWPTRYQVGGVVGPLSALMVNDGQTGFVQDPSRPNPDRKPGDAASLAAATLRTLLIDRGVEVLGGSGTGSAPDDAREVARFDSLPVSAIVGSMLSDSDNTTAELLTREIGRVRTGIGTTQAGIDVIREVLLGLGLPVEDLVMVDGSGLDTTNRVSCRLLLASLLRLGEDSPIPGSLAVAGRTGTLRKRLGDTAAVGKVRAKTGTLATVNALAGFADPKAGATLVFAMVQNGSDPRGNAVTDGFAERVVSFGEGRRLDRLLPLALR